MKKIIHIVSDEKFIDMAYREFEYEAPGKNIFIIPSKPHLLKYIKHANITFLDNNEIKLLLSSEHCCAIIFHSLGYHYSHILKWIPAGKKTIWLGWGYDYYTSLLSTKYPYGLLLSETQQIAKQCISTNLVSSIKKKIKTYIKILVGRKNHISESLLKKVDYFIPVLDVEYKLVLKFNPWFKPKYIPWNYGTLEDDFITDDYDNGELGSNILVGNSAAMENNHSEVFHFIKNNVDFSDRKIVVPLSYGDSRYAEYIIKTGYDLFGSAFTPLRDFMDKDEYIELLQSCGYVFMNHLRQQALGNINIMLSKGAKVFLNSSSPIYDWLVKKDAFVFTIESLLNPNEGKIALVPLSLSEQEHNKQIMMNYWGRNVQRQKTRELIRIALTNQSIHDN